MDNYQAPPPISEEPVVMPSNTSSTPPTVPGSPTPPPTVPRKKLPAKLIATLFGILLLIGGVSAGIVLVNQQQLLEQDAQVACVHDCSIGQTSCQNFGSGNTGYQCTCVAGGPTAECPSGKRVFQCSNFNPGACPPPNATNPPGQVCTPGQIQVGSCGTGGCASNQRPQSTCNGSGTGFGAQQCVSDSGCNTTQPTGTPPTGSCGGQGQACCTGQQNSCNSGLACNTSTQTCLPPTGNNWTLAGGCVVVTSGTVQIQRFSGPSCPTTQTNQGTQTVGTGTYCPTPAQGSCQQVDVVGSDQGVCSCNTTTNPPTTATPTAPGITAVCSALRAFDTSFNELSSSELSALQQGSVVRFAVNGTTTGSFDQARFTINGSLQSPTSLTATVGAATVYYMDYTIPAGVTTFNIGAELHESQGNTWH